MFFSLYGIAFESLAQRNQGVYKLLALALAVLTFRWDPDAAPLGLIRRAAHMHT